MLTKIIKLTVWVAVAFAGGYYTSIELNKPEIKPQPVSVEEVVKKLKAEIVDKIAVCETGGEKDPANTTTYDPARNQERHPNAISYGELQFKVDTLKDWTKRLEGREITTAEAIATALDPAKAKAMATNIIFAEQPGGINAWVNCGGTYKTEVQVIKKIQNYGK